MNKQPIQFTEENIKRLFGFEDAQEEPIDRLNEYYFKGDIFAKVTANLPIRILVGHKGVGKSALFKVAFNEDIEKGNLPILIKPDDIAELGRDPENFLLTIRQWKHGLTKIISEKVLNSLGLDTEGVFAKIAHYGGKVMSFIVESVSTIKETVNLTPAQKILIEKFLKSKKIIVYLDDLDRGWEGKKDDINRISALLNSIKDMSIDNSGLLFKISLRTDVYFLVRTSDESTDKIEGDVVWHSWTNHEILVMLIKRIVTYDGGVVDERTLSRSNQHHDSFHLERVMEKTFHGRGKWEKVPVYRVLMSLIRRRPRDLVKLCTLAARKAYSNKRSVITADDFQSIFEEYSTGRIQDTILEYRSELPDIRRLLFGMKPTKRALTTADNYVFTTAELHLKINKIIESGKFIFANKDIADAKKLSHFLYKINFLTAWKEGGDAGAHRKYFEENQYLSSSFVDFGYDWEIHPAYRWALQPDSMLDIYSKVSLSADD